MPSVPSQPRASPCIPLSERQQGCAVPPHHVEARFRGHDGRTLGCILPRRLCWAGRCRHGARQRADRLVLERPLRLRARLPARTRCSPDVQPRLLGCTGTRAAVPLGEGSNGCVCHVPSASQRTYAAAASSFSSEAKRLYAGMRIRCRAKKNRPIGCSEMRGNAPSRSQVMSSSSSRTRSRKSPPRKPGT